MPETYEGRDVETMDAAELREALRQVSKMQKGYTPYEHMPEPQTEFEVDCPCGGELRIAMPWIKWPESRCFTCAKCGRNFMISTYKGVT
jgi:hypothetical protein